MYFLRTINFDAILNLRVDVGIIKSKFVYLRDLMLDHVAYFTTKSWKGSIETLSDLFELSNYP